jgi:hypothetical protein
VYTKTSSTNENTVNNKETVEYVFEENDNTLKTLSNYLLKNNVNLLCVNRESKNKKENKEKKADINNIINNLDVSLFLTTSQKIGLQ